MGLTIVVQMEDSEVVEVVEGVEEVGVAVQAIMLMEAKEAMEIMEEEVAEGLHTQEMHPMVLREQVERVRKGMMETMGIQLHLSLMEVRPMEAKAVLL